MSEWMSMFDALNAQVRTVRDEAQAIIPDVVVKVRIDGEVEWTATLENTAGFDFTITAPTDRELIASLRERAG